jgi:hypothetical protein
MKRLILALALTLAVVAGTGALLTVNPTPAVAGCSGNGC